MKHRFYSYLASQKWAMTEEMMRVALDISLRQADGPEALEEKLGRQLDNTQTVTYRDGKGGRVAIVPVHGPIFRYANFFTMISGGTSHDILARDFRTAIDDPKVKGVILDVDSPGGQVNGTHEFANSVFRARSEKPVLSYVGSQAASAGYWIASSASRIVMDKTADVGSIGVLMTVGNDAPEDGEHRFISSQSPQKRLDPDKKDHAAIYQAEVDAIAEVFVGDVARNMGVTSEAVVKDFGRGGTLLGSQAVAAGMAHDLGNFEEVVAEMTKPRRIISLPSKASAGALNSGANHMDNEMTTEELRAQLEAMNVSQAAAVQAVEDMRAQLAKSESDRQAIVEEARQERLAADAKGYADAQVRAGHIQPASVGYVTALHLMVSGANSAEGVNRKLVVSGVDGEKEMTALEALTALVESQKVSEGLGEESVAQILGKTSATVLSDGAPSEDRDADPVAKANARRGHKK